MNADELGRLDETARATIEAMDAMAGTAARLAEVEVAGHSPDRRVRVRVTASGRITELTLQEGVLRHYDTAALGELVTRTLRQTQERARDAYDRQLAELVPSEVDSSEQTLHRIWKE